MTLAGSLYEYIDEKLESMKRTVSLPKNWPQFNFEEKKNYLTQ